MMHHRSTATAAAALAIALCASLPARAQTARLGGLPASAQVVTNEQDAAALAALNAANAVISAALTNEAALRAAGDAAGLAAVNATNAVLSAAITNEAALRTAGDAAGLAALYATNAVLRAALTNEAALRAAHTNRTDNPHGVTAAQIGALTSELDPVANAALAAYAAYWPRNATASSRFTFVTNSGAITITGYNIGGGADVVIPDYINGWPVTEIGANAFMERGVTSIGGAGNVVMVGAYAFNGCSSLSSVSLPQVQTVEYAAFYSCTSLTSVSLPQVQAVGENAFNGCSSLSSVSLPQVQTVEYAAFYSCTSLTSVSLPQAQTVGDAAFASCSLLASISLPQVQTVGNSAFSYCTSLASASLPQVQAVGAYAFNYCSSLASLYFDNDTPTIGADIFADITPNQVTIYVTDPTATGWGATLGGMPVVRLPLYADAIYQAGELVATVGHVAQAIAAIPGIVYSNSVSALTIYTNASGAATSWWQVASGVTNSGSFASGTPGAITNGMRGAVLNGLTITNNNLDVLSSITIGGDTTYNTWQQHLYQAVYPAFPTLYAQGLVFDNANSRQLRVFHVASDGTGGIVFLTGVNTSSMSERMRIQTSSGDVSIWNSLTVAKTNTAAEVSTLGGYSIFDSGSNCYWRVTASNGTFYASDTNGVRKFKFTTETP